MLFHIHRNTVREWIRRGLPTTDDRRPALVLGNSLRDFLRARRQRSKRPCQPGEIYCVRCRVPRNPAGGIAEFQPGIGALGSLVGICPQCESMIYRRVNPANLDLVKGCLEIVTAERGSTHMRNPLALRKQ